MCVCVCERERMFRKFHQCNNLVHHHVGSSGGARGVVVIVVGNGHGDTSSNPERD